MGKMGTTTKSFWCFIWLSMYDLSVARHTYGHVISTPKEGEDNLNESMIPVS